MPEEREDIPLSPAAVKVKLLSAQTGYALELNAEIVGHAYTFITLVAVALFVQPPVLETVYVIVEVPTVVPVTTPAEALTVAADVLPDVHVPPETVEVKVVEAPTKIFWAPDNVPALGGAVTVTVLVAVASSHPPVPATL
jgi:hypothetical protein